MKKTTLILFMSSAILATSTFATSVISAEDPIAVRRAIMANVGDAARMGGAMLKGQMEYNEIAGQLILRVMNQAALGVGELFPKGTETGGKTTASAKVWEDKAGFNAALAKFQSDTAASIMKPEEAEFFDQESFAAAFSIVTKNCASCHKVFRIPQN